MLATPPALQDPQIRAASSDLATRRAVSVLSRHLADVKPWIIGAAVTIILSGAIHSAAVLYLASKAYKLEQSAADLKTRIRSIK